MALATIVVLAFLAHKGIKHAKASPFPESLHHHNHPECTSFTLPVPVTAHNAIYDVIPVNNNINASAYVVDIDTWDSKTAAERVINNITISKTYNIHTTLCIPSNGAKKNNLQIATHGGGFDSRYWDIAINPDEHSYVRAALDSGYSILTYDRLACGLSDHPDAYTEAQAPAELEVLRGITEMARSGGLSKYLPGPSSHMKPHTTFDKFIHVGHSYGSFLTMGLATTYPDLSDGMVFTGLIPNDQMQAKWSVFGWEYALENDPKLFADAKSGYLIQGTPTAVQTCFLHAVPDKVTGIGGFDPELREYAFSIRQPGPVIVALAFSTLKIDPSHFKGHVQFMLAEFDFLVCAGDCKGTYDLKELQDVVFKEASTIDVYIQNGTGHGLPFHNGARQGFEATLAWLDRSGL